MKKTFNQIIAVVVKQVLITVVSAAIVAEATAIISIEVRLARIETALNMHLQQATPNKSAVAVTNPNP